VIVQREIVQSAQQEIVQQEIVQSARQETVQIVPREIAPVAAARVDVDQVVLADPVRADASSSGARRSASSAWRRSTQSTTAMCACCSNLSLSGARLFPAA
jgi:hypothetical protein